MNPGCFAPACSPSADLLASLDFESTAPRNPWRVRSQRPGGIKPASVRLFDSAHRQPGPLGNILYHTASGQTFQPVGRESSAKVLRFFRGNLETTSNLAEMITRVLV